MWFWFELLKEEDISSYDPIEELGDYDISKYLVGH